jgi:hypothetical protein
MSTVNTLDAMIAQYEKNNAPRYEKTEAKVYDLKNYFNTFLPKGVNTATKQVRILPTSDGSTPFVEFHGHKVQVDGDWKTLPCLKHEKGEPCPFCEARDLLLATGKDSDKEFAKKYNARKMYVVKVIDRENEADGVKFWRFNHSYSKDGVYDKFMGILNAIKKDVTNADTGRDLLLTINRNANGVPIVSAIATLDPSPLTENEVEKAEWLADSRTWRDVYAERNYEYLAIIVNGGVPTWDKEAKCFVDGTAKTKPTETENVNLGVENVKANIQTATETKSTAVIEDDNDDLPF